MWEKIKEKLKKSWKWIVGALVGTTVIVGVANYTETPPVVLTNVQLAEQCITTSGKIDGCVGDLSTEERANIKSTEIAKLNFVGEYTDLIYKMKVEIQSLKKIEMSGQYGVEIMVRARQDDKQLGFGDGSEELGRFRIFNPPVLVDDPNGDIVKEWMQKDEATGEMVLKQRKLREDPAEAIRQSLTYAIKVVSKPLISSPSVNSHTFDTNLRFTGATSPLASNYTAGAGTTLLTLGIVTAGSTNRAGGAPTYNGVALTQADSTRKYATSPETSCELWYLIDPPTSSAYSISVPNTGTKTLYVQASTYKTRSQYYTSVLDVSGGNTGLSANPSVSVTTTGNGDVIVGVLGDGLGTAPTATTGTSLNMTDDDDGAYSDSNQYKLQSSAGAYATGWTVASDDWCLVVAAFKEVVRPGYTNTTFYAPAGDGKVYVTGTGTWASVRDAATGTVSDTDTSTTILQGEYANPSTGYVVVRAFFPFNTAAIPDTDTISSAVLSLYETADAGNKSNGDSGVVVNATVPGSGALAAGDYDNNVGGAAGSALVSLTTIVDGGTAYYDWTLNATGLTYVSKTGYTNLAVQSENDRTNATPTLRGYAYFYFAEQTGTTNDPMLIVVHAVAGGVPIKKQSEIFF